MDKPEGYVFELPLELQRIIFEIAARRDGRCACTLIQVAKYVQKWIHPILYERIVVKTPQAAASILAAIQANPNGYITPWVKSLTLGPDIPHTFAKPIFAMLSRRLISFSIFRNPSDSDHLLRFVRSPFIRRLTLVYDGMHYSRPYDIPHEFLPCITHLTLINDGCRRGFRIDHAIAVSEALAAGNMYWLQNFTTPFPKLPPFHNLTHVAASWCCWLPLNKILNPKLAQLKCFAVLLSKNSGWTLRNRAVTAAESKADPRVVVVTRYGSSAEWNMDDGYGPSNFWTIIEDLVRELFICDDGEYWDVDVARKFKLSHPDIVLLSDLI